MSVGRSAARKISTTVGTRASPELKKGTRHAESLAGDRIRKISLLRGLLAFFHLAEQLLDGCRHLLASRAREANHALVVEHVDGRPAAHSPL